MKKIFMENVARLSPLCLCRWTVLTAPLILRLAEGPLPSSSSCRDEFNMHNFNVFNNPKISEEKFLETSLYFQM